MNRDWESQLNCLYYDDTKLKKEEGSQGAWETINYTQWVCPTRAKPNPGRRVLR